MATADFSKALSFIVLVLIAWSTKLVTAHAQTIININDNETLTETDLSVGAYGGVQFSLTPTTTFNINNGGTIETNSTFSDAFDFEGSKLNLNNGGIYTSGPSFEQINAKSVTLQVFEGGSVAEDRIYLSDSLVNVTGGGIGGSRETFVSKSVAFSRSSVNISNGTIGHELFLFGFEPAVGEDTVAASVTICCQYINSLGFYGSTVNATGGFVGSESFSMDKSTLNISGGIVGGGLEAEYGSEINISGGQIGNGLRVRFRSSANITGGIVGDRFGVYAGNVNISDGIVGDYFGASRSIVNISGGSFGSNFVAGTDGVVLLHGGSIGNDAVAELGSTFYIAGGAVGNNFEARTGSEINFFSGSVGDDFSVGVGAVLNVAGGTIGKRFAAYDGSSVNLFVTELSVNGVPIELSSGAPVEIEIGETSLLEPVLVRGLLADGTSIEWQLTQSEIATIFVPDLNYFHRRARLFATLPLPGDMDFDGDVDGADFLRWQRGGSPDFLSAEDLADWGDNFSVEAILLSASSTSTPEPTSFLLATLAGLFALGTTSRRKVSRVTVSSA